MVVNGLSADDATGALPSATEDIGLEGHQLLTIDGKQLFVVTPDGSFAGKR